MLIKKVLDPTKQHKEIYFYKKLKTQNDDDNKNLKQYISEYCF